MEGTAGIKRRGSGGLWVVGIVLALAPAGWPAAAGPEDAGGSSTGSAGTYELRPLEGQLAWQLPKAGEGNRCERGEAASVRWSPDGRYLISEVDSGQSITLCLYDLSGFSFSAGRPRLVEVHRVTSSGSLAQGPGRTASDERLTRVGEGAGDRPGQGGAGRAVQHDTARDAGAGGRSAGNAGGAGRPPGKESIYSRLLQGRSGYTFTELEPAWSARTESSPVLAFTRGSGSSWTRIFGLSDLNFDVTSRAGALDGQLAGASGPWSFYQPVFGPVEAGSGIEQQGLTAVSNFQLSCGKSRIVYLARPAERGAVVQPLTSPCSAAGRMENAADRYPAWDPRPGQDRLAFVRANPDGVNQLCVLEGARSRGGSHLDCTLAGNEKSSVDRFSPVWSSDGRFLVYYSLIDLPDTKSHSSERAERGVRIEVIDFSSRDRKPRIILQDVRPNPFPGPPLLHDATTHRTWVLGVTGGTRETGQIVAMPLDGSTPGTGQREFRTGLQNIRAVDVVHGRGGLELAVAAQGYRDVRGADLRGYKVFILPLAIDGW